MYIYVFLYRHVPSKDRSPWLLRHDCVMARGLRFLRGFCAPRQVAEEISRFGAMAPHPQSVKSVLSCTEPTQLLEFLKEA